MRVDLRYAIIRLRTPFASTVRHYDEGVTPPVAHFISLHVGAVPPAAAQGLEEGDRVRVAVGLCQDHTDQGREIYLLGIEQLQGADLAKLQLLAGQPQALLRRALGSRRRAQSVAVELNRLQRVSHVLEGGDDGAAVHRGRLIPASLGGALALLQREAVEDR